jgi:hypothetical protein
VFVDALPGPVRKLLTRLGREESTQVFYLAGGSAVALHLGHRISVDLDFFTKGPDFDADGLLHDLGSIGPIDIEQQDRRTLLGRLEGLREPQIVTHASEAPGFVVAADFTEDGAVDLCTGGGAGIFLTRGAEGAGRGEPFLRGAANADGNLDIGDPITVLGWLFLGSKPLACEDSADSNDDARLDLSDAVGLLAFLFLSGEAPPSPFGTCGFDSEPDGLGCAAFPPCSR